MAKRKKVLPLPKIYLSSNYYLSKIADELRKIRYYLEENS